MTDTNNDKAKHKARMQDRKLGVARPCGHAVRSSNASMRTKTTPRAGTCTFLGCLVLRNLGALLK